VESSVIEQADAGACAVCFRAGATGAYRADESIARAFDLGAFALHEWAGEFAFGTCNACGFTLEDECGA
jgi:hypothetical protein